MAKKKKAPNPITFAKLVLRNSSRKWYANNEVFKRCRVSRGNYKCEGCGQILKKKNLQIDHIDPVVDIKTGFQNLHDWVLRLFVPPEKLQALCYFERDTGEKDEKGKTIIETWGCHPLKTSGENSMREYYKNLKKEIKKNEKIFSEVKILVPKKPKKSKS